MKVCVAVTVGERREGELNTTCICIGLHTSALILSVRYRESDEEMSQTHTSYS